MENNNVSKHICSNLHRLPIRNHGARVEQYEMSNVTSDMCNSCEKNCEREHGADDYITNLTRDALRNQDFRVSIWTGQNLQCTLMCIPRGGKVGLEIHKDTDQFITVQRGIAQLVYGESSSNVDKRQTVHSGE